MRRSRVGVAGAIGFQGKVRTGAEPLSEDPWEAVGETLGEGDEQGPAARRRPKAVREAYVLYVERAAEGANEADGPLSSA